MMCQLNKMYVFSIINMINDVSAKQNACFLNNKHDKMMCQLNKMYVFSIINMINDVSAKQNVCFLHNKHEK